MCVCKPVNKSRSAEMTSTMERLPKESFVDL